MRSKEEREDAKLLGQALKTLRTAKRLSQRQLAAGAGVSRQTVVSVERGWHYPRLPVLRKILAALGATLADLYILEETITPAVGRASIPSISPEDALAAAIDLAQEASWLLAHCRALLKVAAR